MILVKIDPATIGLLISIAPTVLDLLFGRGHYIKNQALIQNLKAMYGYGLEGFGYNEGEGFRYPPIEEYYDEPTTTATVQKEGPRKGMEIKRYLPKVDDRWVAAYLLNKRLAAKNEWRKYATRALQEASKRYLEDLKTKDLGAYTRAIEKKKKREARKGRIPLPLRSAEAKKLLTALQDLDDEALLTHYYFGRKPGKIPKKIRTKYPLLVGRTKELAVPLLKKDSVGQEVLLILPVQKTRITERIQPVIQETSYSNLNLRRRRI
jgi:hypothetical protein